VIGRRRLIPDIDAGSGRDTVRLLNRRIPDGDVLPHLIVRGDREDDDAVRVADGRIGFDDVAVARNDADAEIDGRAR
jgi:hypothetical protein